MRRGLRLALWAWFFIGLLGVSYVGVVWVSSAALTDEAAAAMGHPDDPKALRAGESVVLLPLAGPEVALDPAAASSFGGAGTVVVWALDGDEPSELPGMNVARHVGRLLARAEFTSGAWTVAAGNVTLATNVTNVTLAGVPAWTARGAPNGTVDLAVDLASLGTASGWIVKADLWTLAVAVPDVAIRGTVEASMPTGALHAGLVVSVVGTLLPLGLIVYHHEPRGASVAITLPSRPGAEGTPGKEVACPECRRPVSAGATFCLRCGAMVPAAKPPP